MRVVFLVPDLRPGGLARLRGWGLLRRLAPLPQLATPHVFGGTLNLMRHCRVVRGLGHEGVIATASGRDGYGARRGIGPLPTIAWSERRREDLCVLPDVYTNLIDAIAGRVVAYLQNPLRIRNDFDHTRANVLLWTDSPPMLARCRAAYADKDVALVPNVVDAEAFPFIPQAQRAPGELVAFPRKGAAFIDAVEQSYQARGGRYWRLERVDGLPFAEFARRMRTPQAFLASADVEGCALPPQECMAAGIAVVGKDAEGANFCMRDGETARVATTPEGAADALLALEDPGLRERLTRAGLRHVRHLFPDAEPTRFWASFLGKLT